ncbi:16S rRNA (cytidine1402-2'-O)-methyltransferase [Crenobacter luteus]|uniref:16S rRNA (cytidine(1402)-2'-O)-methyltransferase n=1 Tax=Crenobacter luteus TaxID=1452487 RepID=UPI001052D8F4|nr:16S rRNA (cytidine(1402)-2'-O)-methyltransferase [Crenobacter luteus]TCP12985.1 16S rRNA (cytidine1402-2'-O)-methyltransferase [Crenobacter luteus]
MVATPIGNLADISLRALAAFSVADIVCAEDTRVTGQLLSAYGLKCKLVSVREHNERAMAEQVVGWLAEGRIVVQVSDAGTPAVSDPGARLVARVREAGHPVSPLPGASAVVAALSASGLATGRFLFAGFLPPKSGERRRTLEAWQDCDYCVVCYEAPHRLVDTLEDVVATLGAERPVLLARELTKTFETLRLLPAGELLDWVKNDSNQQRGEIVLIIDAAPAREGDGGLDAESERILALLAAELPTKQAAGLAAAITGLPRKQLYDAALRLKSGN